MTTTATATDRLSACTQSNWVMLLLLFCQFFRFFSLCTCAYIALILSHNVTAAKARLSICLSVCLCMCECVCVLGGSFVLFLCQQRLAGLIFHVLCFACCVLPVRMESETDPNTRNVCMLCLHTRAHNITHTGPNIPLNYKVHMKCVFYCTCSRFCTQYQRQLHISPERER